MTFTMLRHSAIKCLPRRFLRPPILLGTTTTAAAATFATQYSSARDDSESSHHFIPGASAFGNSPKLHGVICDLFHSFARSQDTPSGENVATLGVDDLRDLFIAIGEKPSDETIERIAKEVDTDGNGMIDLEEFLNGCDKILGGASRENCEEETVDIDVLVNTFRNLDRDGNGVLTRDEIEGLLSTTGVHIKSCDAKEIFELADMNGSGEIDLSEFIAFMADPSRTSHAWRLKSAFRVILIIGGPGSGKGVLSKKLKDRVGVVCCSSGEILREEVASDSALGKSLASTLEDGKLVPSTTMVALLKKEIGRVPGSIVALDGFPRSLENYQDFDEICGPPECAIFIDVPDDIMIERILHRGKSGSGRSDDNIETATKRIALFHELTKPTLECVRENGIPVHVLDGAGTPQDVWQQLMDLDTPISRRLRAQDIEIPA